MAELILMRHAAALPAAAGASDFERPLSSRGRAAAVLAARRLSASGARVDRLLYSSARRTRETASIVARELALDPAALHALEELYAANPNTIRAAIQRNHAEANTLLVVGHNPGISDFGGELIKGLSPEQLATAAYWRVPLGADGWGLVTRGKAAQLRPAR